MSKQVIIDQSYYEWKCQGSAVGTNKTVTFILCCACGGGVLPQVLKDELVLGSREELQAEGTARSET